MRALRVEALSDDLSGVALREIAEPDGDGVLVEVHAASLNFPDLLMTRGDYQFKPEPPFTSGMELAGEVLAAPPGSGLSVGDRVMGGAKTGAFAERAVVPRSGLRAIPAGLSYPAAAALGAAYSTAYTALVELGGLKAGQWVAVTGASGGVGLAALDLAKALGARTIALTGSPRKLERIEAAVNPDAVVLTEGRFRERVAELTDGARADLVLDLVGGSVFDECTRCVAFGGKLLVAGFAGGAIPSIAANIPLIKGFSLVGVRAGEYAKCFPLRGERIHAALADMVADGKLSPTIDRTLPLESWRDGFDAMAARELVGKVVFAIR